jgi:hypothetical protein
VTAQIINTGAVDITEDISWAFYFNGSLTPFATGVHTGGLLVGQSANITVPSQGNGLYGVEAWIGLDTSGPPDSTTACSQLCIPTNTPTATPSSTNTATATSTPSNTPTPSSTATATTTPTFTPTATVFVPVTGGPTLASLCSNTAGQLSWQVNNNSNFNISFTWFVVGGTTTGGPFTVNANSSTTFTSAVAGSLPNQVAILWADPANGTIRSSSASNPGDPCSGGQATPTPTATPEPGVLIPVTGFEFPKVLRESMVLNMGIGAFGFTLILLGVGISWDRKEDDEEWPPQ